MWVASRSTLAALYSQNMHSYGFMCVFRCRFRHQLSIPDHEQYVHEYRFSKFFRLPPLPLGFVTTAAADAFVGIIAAEGASVGIIATEGAAVGIIAAVGASVGIIVVMGESVAIIVAVGASVGIIVTGSTVKMVSGAKIT